MEIRRIRHHPLCLPEELAWKQQENLMPKPTSNPAFFALISDIHANIDALESVLTDIADFPVRGIFCLGDIVGYGPEPANCVQMVMETCAVSVVGNHEAMLFLCDEFPAASMGAIVGNPIKLAREQLDEKQMKWLHTLPLVADINPISLSHAALNAPENFDYIHDHAEAKSHFCAQSTFISFQGHTHVPVVWEENTGKVLAFNPCEKTVRLDENKRYAVNVGSVGQPRDNDPRASYVLYDPQNRLLLHRRVKYDIALAQTRFQHAKLPRENARRIKKGQ